MSNKNDSHKKWLIYGLFGTWLLYSMGALVWLADSSARFLEPNSLCRTASF